MIKQKRLFFFKDIDAHYIIKIFGICFRVKHKTKFQYKQATIKGISDTQNSPQIIVSLTTFPARIKTTHIAINTLLRQTLKPNKIILWLANEEFPNGINDLPKELLQLRELGLTIEWCDNLKSYKKIVPALRKYPNDIIVTADDDMYYAEDWLESLYKSYLENPDYIHVQRAGYISVEENNFKIIPARDYLYKTITTPGYYNKISSGSGCLFPPHSLHSDIFGKNDFLSVLPTQDDYYLWAMSVLNKTKIKIVKGFEADLLCIDNTQNSGLCKSNNKQGNGLSGQQALDKLLETYPQIKDILKNEKTNEQENNQVLK